MRAEFTAKFYVVFLFFALLISRFIFISFRLFATVRPATFCTAQFLFARSLTRTRTHSHAHDCSHTFDSIGFSAAFS